MPRAAIDIGSNSILLTVMGDDGAVLHDEARVVRMGAGLGDRGLFAPDRIAAASKVLTDYLARARGFGIEPIAVRAVATSAARRAMNAQTVFERFHRNLGLRVRIISGEEEAQLTWRGAQHDLSIEGSPQLVVDLGGGSTELAMGEHGELQHHASLELGTARLTERFLPMDGEGRYPSDGRGELRAYVAAELMRYPFSPRPTVVVGVAGTVTTLAAMNQGLQTYQRAPVHGSLLSRTYLSSIIGQLGASTGEERQKLVAVSPDRADFVLAGAVVLDEVLATVELPHLIASDGGLRFALTA